MSVYFNIEKALADAISSLKLPCPVGKFGVEFSDEEKGDDLWVQPHHLPGAATPVTCGYLGEDEHKGILQFDINYPMGKGSGKLLQLADTIRKAFQAGDTFWYKDQWVKVRSCSLSPEMKVGGFQKRYMTITYYARSVRHT